MARTEKLFRIVVKVGESKVGTIVDLLKSEVNSLSFAPCEDQVEQVLPKKKTEGNRAESRTGKIVLNYLKERPNEEVGVMALSTALMQAGFSPTTINPILSILHREGYITRPTRSTVRLVLQPPTDGVR